MASRYLGHDMPVVGPGVRTGMPLRFDNPREIGADRLVNAIAAHEALGGPCVIVDFGTAMTFDCVSAGGEYLGGIIVPGVEISLEALTTRAAAIPKIDLAGPARWSARRPWTRSARAWSRFRRQGRRDRRPAARGARGGRRGDRHGRAAAAIVPFCETIDEVDALLTLTGLRLIWDVTSPKAPPAT